MTREDTEVPRALREAIAAAESDSRRAMDLHPPADWHDCPEWGHRLHAQSVIHDGDDLLAVQYACDCLTLWTWEQATDQLYYRGASERIEDCSGTGRNAERP